MLRRLPWLAAACGVAMIGSQPPAPDGGALEGVRHRIIISTDIGGSDPDDFQSFVHYLVYADLFDSEGFVSSPPGAGRKSHFLEVIDAYAKDLPRLRTRSRRYPAPDRLRAVCKQGAIDPSPAEGYAAPTEGSDWIVRRARVRDRRPLWVLVWGSMTDVAQALHDAPDIAPKLRVYCIGSWNTRNDRAALAYVRRAHPNLWLIEANTTFRGMYVGGNQEGDLGNLAFVERHVRGHGALGDLFYAKKRDIKMGDSPSLLYLLKGPADDPSAEHWGGAFVRSQPGKHYWTDDPNPALVERDFAGAETVNRWREAYLRDWAARMECLAPAPAGRPAGPSL